MPPDLVHPWLAVSVKTLIDLYLQLIERLMSGSTSLANMLGDINLVDVWRTIYSAAKNFTFYSHPQRECTFTYSRIDYFFVPPQVVGLINTYTIRSTHISDRSPVYIDVGLNKPDIRPQKFDSPLIF